MISVACASDANFYPFVGTMLCSAFENTTDKLIIYLLCHGIPENVLHHLKSFAQTRGHQLHPIVLDTTSLASLRVDKHVSVATYYRLLLPQILPSDLERVIYLDCDLIVRKPLRSLWLETTSLKGLAAVRDFHYDRPNETRWGFPEDQSYFNAGVLLIDLKAWRADNVAQVVIDRIRRDPDNMELWDQDGLNLEFAGAWRELPLEWNVQQYIFTDPRMGIRFADLAKDPAIVHFTGGIKPWFRDTAHPYIDEFLHYHSLNPLRSHYRSPPAKWRDRLRSGKRKMVSMYHATLPKVAALEWLWHAQPLREMDRLVDARQRHLTLQTQLAQENDIQKALSSILPDLTVPSGPFKGLRYDPATLPDRRCGPKVLGCYEAELGTEIAAWLRLPWAFVLNIGCGNGHYAVGFSRFQMAPVIGYDSNPLARDACERLAKLNGVERRLEVRSSFALRELEQFASVPGRGLVICDCGGAEQHLFHPDVPGFARLAMCDLVIELHEAVQPGVSTFLCNLFAPTHEVRFVPSVDDLARPRVYPCATLQALNYSQQVRFQAEHRFRAAEWLVLKAKGALNLPR